MATVPVTKLFADESQAAAYRSTRPNYPDALYQAIEAYSGQSLRSMNVVDVGCGSGQATVALAARTATVIGVDPSPAQLANAESKHNITYKEGTGEATGVPSLDMDLFTCAQSMHWCDPVALYSEAARVLVPDTGVFAAWGYDVNTVHAVTGGEQGEEERAARVHELQKTLFYETLDRQYWNSARDKVSRHLRDPGLAPHGTAMSDEEAARLGLQPVDGVGLAKAAGQAVAGNGSFFHRVCRWEGSMEAVWSLAHLLSSYRSWSGYTIYMKAKGLRVGSEEDPVCIMEQTVLREVYPGRSAEDIQFTVRWPLFMLLGQRTSVVRNPMRY